MKFTRRGVIRLKVTAQQKDDRSCILSFTVQDTGMGIDKQHLDTIFDSFFQSDRSICRKYQGSGLGLAISRNLCQLMGGDIRVESKQNQGSSFYFTIRVRLTDIRESYPLKSHGEMQTKVPPLSILLVEDNPINRQLARMVLEKRHHRVDAAANGVEALEKLTAQDYDVILMDVQMPEMDGFTATRIIRQMEEGAFKGSPKVVPELAVQLGERLLGGHQIIIALTAHAMRGDKIKCMDSGMDDYLTKPFVPEQIDIMLKKHCSIQSS